MNECGPEALSSSMAVESSAMDGSEARNGESAAAREVSGTPRWRRLLPFAKLLISIGLIAWILSAAELSRVLACIQQADVNFLVIAFLLLPLGLLFGTARWMVLLSTQGVHASMRFLYGSHLVAAFLKQFLPSTIGGDAFRGYDSWRAGASKSVAVATVGVDRLMGLLVLSLFAAGAVLFTGFEGIWILRLLAIGAAASLLLVVGWIFLPTPNVPSLIQKGWSLLPRYLRRPVEKLLGALMGFKDNPRALICSFVFSVMIQLNVVVFYWVIARSLGIDIAAVQMLFIAPIAVFVMMLPITINGIGLREGAWVGLLALCGVDKESAVALAWLEYGIMLAFGLLGGIVYVLRTSKS